MRRLSFALTTAALLGSCAPPAEPPSAGRSEESARDSSHGRGAVLRNVELGVASWQEGDEHLALQLVVANHGEGFAIFPAGFAELLRLEDANGDLYPVLRVEPVLAAALAAGIPPTATEEGALLFPRTPSPPVRLHAESFEPLELRLATLPEEEHGQLLARLESAVVEKLDPPSEARLDPTLAVEEEIARLLDRRARSLQTRDFTGYLETVHPGFRDRERSYFRQSHQVPFAEVSLEARRISPTEGKDGSRTVLAELRYRLQGQPEDNPFVHRLAYRLVEADGRWLVGEVSDDAGRPVFWRQPQLLLHRTHHFLIFVWPQASPDVMDIARQAEGAYATLLRSGLPLAPRYVAHLISSRELFRRLIGSDLAVGAAVSRQVSLEGETRVDSRAFFLNGPLLSPYRLGASSSDEQQVTITHELVHLVLASDTRPHTPPWLVEGSAVYFSDGLDYDSSRLLARSGLESLSVSRLTRVSRLGAHDNLAERAAAEYLFSGNLVAFLVKRFGRERFLEFYRSFAAQPLGSDTTVATESGLQEHFALSQETLEAAFEESMRLQFR